MSTRLRPHPLLLALLVVSWCLALLGLLANMELLTPWDPYGVGQRPARGTWEREVNDFFEHTPAALALPLGTVAASVLLFRRRLRREGNIAGTGWRLGLECVLTNVALFVLAPEVPHLAGTVAAAWRAGPSASVPPGYARDWPQIAAYLAVLGLYLLLQTRGFWPSGPTRTRIPPRRFQRAAVTD